ncbi:MAG: hypothetical protein U0805_11400 [Pirellulales bacterium]
MAGREDIQAGRATVELRTKNAPLDKGLRDAQTKLKNFAGTMGSVGAAAGAAGAVITSAFAGALAIFNEVGSALNDMAARTGVAVDTLSELKYAAEQSGASMEDVEKAARFMAKNHDKRDFFEVARGIAAIEDPSDRAAAAMKAWGKAGTMLLPMIADLDELRAKAEHLGLVWDKSMTDKADRLGDAIDTLKSQFVALAANIAAAVAPAVSAAAEWLSEYLAVAIEFVKNNQEAVVAIGAVGVALVAIGATLGTAAAAFGGLAVAMGAVVSVGPEILAVLGIGAGVAAALVTLSTQLDIVTAGVAGLSFEVFKSITGWKGWRAEIAGVGDELKTTFAYLNAMNKVANAFRNATVKPNGPAGPHDYGNIGTGGMPGFFGPRLDQLNVQGIVEQKRKWDADATWTNGAGAMAGAVGALDPMTVLKASGQLDKLEEELKRRAANKKAADDDRKHSPNLTHLGQYSPQQEVFGTFSAAAATAGGTGDSPMTREQRETNKLMRQLIAENNRLRMDLNKGLLLGN